MTALKPATTPRTRTLENLDDWISGDPALAPNSIRLLQAYREALSRANAREIAERSSSSPQRTEDRADNSQSEEAKQVSPEANDPAQPPAAENTSAHRRAISSVPRIEQTPGVPTDQLSQLHGRLIALGFLKEEPVGRAGGIAYRLTRDALRRLSQEESPEAA